MISWKKTLCVSAAFIALICMNSAALAAQPNDNDIVGTIEEPLRMSEGLSKEAMTDTTTQELSLGAAAADAARFVSGANIAILNGGELYHNIQPGQVTWSTVKEAFSVERELGVATVTPSELADLLEFGFSHMTIDDGGNILLKESSFDGFPQISGFNVRFDASAPPYSRVLEMTLSNGKALDPEDSTTELTLAATTYMLGGGYGYTVLEFSALGMSQAEALADYIESGIKTGYEDEATARIRVLGTSQSFFVNSLDTRWMLMFTAVALAAVAVFGTWRKFAIRNNDDEYIDSHKGRDQ